MLNLTLPRTAAATMCGGALNGAHHRGVDDGAVWRRCAYSASCMLAGSGGELERRRREGSILRSGSSSGAREEEEAEAKGRRRLWALLVYLWAKEVRVWDRVCPRSHPTVISLVASGATQATQIGRAHV